MREILFRAKRKDNGEWIEGNVLQCDDGDCYIATSCLVGASDEPLLVAAYKIEPETLCQFTGLTGKNGKQICENDIVKHEISDTLGTVKWYQEDYVGWCVDDVMIDEQQFTDEMWNECEVIGNAFDDKHLLNKSDYCREQEKETED